MVALKSSGVARFLKSPDPACRAVLVYGPDAGLVSERASALAEMFAREGARVVVAEDDGVSYLKIPLNALGKPNSGDEGKKS